MATAAAKPDSAEADAPKGKGKKKLIIILVAVLLLLALAGGGAVFMMKKKAAAAAAAEDGEAAEEVEHGSASKHSSGPPTFVPLDPFVVNLADKGSDRYAQIAVTLQIDDPHFAEQLKLYMPAIRNTILMILANKTSEELLARSGKEALAEEIMQEILVPMGLDGGGHGGKGGSKKKPHNPIQKVHFANFIIQ